MSLHRRRSWVALVASAGAAFGLPRAALAHAFAQRYDLPVPLGLWVTGAALAVALSFAVIGLFAMLVWDIVDKSAQFTTALFLIFLVVAVWALRWHNAIPRKIG